MIRKNLRNYPHKKFFEWLHFLNLYKILVNLLSDFGWYVVVILFKIFLKMPWGYYCGLSCMAGYEEVYYSTKIAGDEQVTTISKRLGLSIAVHILSRLVLGIRFHAR